MENEFLAWLRKRLPPHPQMLLGPGDDAAVLSFGPGTNCVATSDMLVDGVHFRLAECGARRVGHKALAVNLSDLAAMAARPVAVVVSMAVPRKHGGELARGLYEGMLELAGQFHVAVAGGDTNCWNGPLAVNVTAFGETTSDGLLRRDGARPGDQILVTGSFGGSILGRHLDFLPRVSEALRLNARYELHAGIDVSDGLARDLAHIAEESRCGAAVELHSIPIADAARRLSEQADDGRTALDHALSDGEDFELIFAVPPDEARRILADQPLDTPTTKIGQFVAECGLWRVSDDGHRQPLEPRGYEH